MLLDKTIGTRLRNTLEAVQPYPVLVTDRKGVVVASAKSRQLGQKRSCAQKKLDAWPNTFQTNDDNVRCITYKGTVIGAIELDGLPPDDHAYLAMAGMIAELLLEKEGVTVQAERMNKPLQELLTNLVGIHPSNHAQLEKDLIQNGFNPAIPRTTILIQLSQVEEMPSNRETREPLIDERQYAYTVDQFLKWLPVYFSDKDDFILPNPQRMNALVLCADRSKTLDVNTISIFNICQELNRQALRGQLLDMHAVIGSRCCCIEDYELQSEQLEIRLSAGRLLRLDQNIILGPSVVLGSMVLYDKISTRRKNVSFIFGKLLESKQRDILLDTLHTYFDCNMNVTLTAQRLFIHRNTLQQRLQRIAELTGYSTDTANGLLTLRLGLLYYSSLLCEEMPPPILTERT